MTEKSPQYKSITTTEPAAITPTSIIQQAVAAGAPVDQLQQLLELQERYEANEARKQFNVAVAEFKQNPPTIIKNVTVAYGQTKYRHVSLDAVVDAITPPLSALGLSIHWDVAQEQQIKVTCILSHSGGHSESVSMAGPADDSGKKNAIQQIGSTVSYLSRYTLLSLLGLAARDADDDGRGGISQKTTPITDDQVLQIMAYVAENELDHEAVGAYLKSKGFEHYADLPAVQFPAFMAMLKRSLEHKNDNQ